MGQLLVKYMAVRASEDKAVGPVVGAVDPNGADDEDEPLDVDFWTGGGAEEEEDFPSPYPWILMAG